MRFTFILLGLGLFLGHCSPSSTESTANKAKMDTLKIKPERIIGEKEKFLNQIPELELPFRTELLPQNVKDIPKILEKNAIPQEMLSLLGINDKANDAKDFSDWYVGKVQNQQFTTILYGTLNHKNQVIYYNILTLNPQNKVISRAPFAWFAASTKDKDGEEVSYITDAAWREKELEIRLRLEYPQKSLSSVSFNLYRYKIDNQGLIAKIEEKGYNNPEEFNERETQAKESVEFEADNPFNLQGDWEGTLNKNKVKMSISADAQGEITAMIQLENQEKNYTYKGELRQNVLHLEEMQGKGKYKLKYETYYELKGTWTNGEKNYKIVLGKIE